MELKTRQIAILAVANVIFTLGFGIIIPVLPYYSRNLGADAFILGLLMASFSLMQFIFAPYWGMLSDRIGRKPVLAIGLVGFGLSFIIFGLSTQLWMLFLSRIVGGILSAGIFPASFALIADITEPGERGKIMGWMGAAAGLGIIFGPAICGVFVPFGMSVPFFVAGAIALVTVAALYVVMPESRAVTIDMHAKKASIADSFKAIVTSLRTPIGVFLLLTMLINFALACYEGTFSYFLMDRFHLSSEALSSVPMLAFLNISIDATGPTLMAFLFTAMGIVMLFGQGVLVGLTLKHLKEEKTVILGLLLSCAGLVAVLIAPDFVTLLLAACVIGIGSGLVMPSLSAYISNRTDKNTQGSALGVMGSYNSLGRIVGPPIGGFAYDVNMVFPYISSSILLALGALSVVVIMRGGKQEKVEPLVSKPPV